MKKTIFGLFAITLIMSCGPKTKVSESAIMRENFNKQVELGKTDLYTLKNEGGIEIKMTNYGARIVSILMPDAQGNYDDIVLGFNTIDDYITRDNMYLGCIVGRFANRIANGKFSLDGQEFQLEQNEGTTTLHGGKKGYDKVLWDAVQDGNSITMTYTSPDGEQGFPGEVKVKQVFTLTPENEIIMEFFAETNKKTVINLTNHTYLNLKGEGNGDILAHKVEINADMYTPVDSLWIPTGEIAAVDGTPFDFRTPTAVGARVNDDNQQLKNGKGYDHNWVLKKDSTELSFASRVFEETTGRMLEIYTIEPALQFYCGNFMDSSVSGKSGKTYVHRGAFIFEPQHYPDSPNQENFPSTVLEPGEKYYHKSVYKFSVKK
ncbi:MAG: galactose mutarotase [Bacteroidales bacterium]|nr:galactose mutarotase [Bacteroidales bacterium]MBN2818682.1 galactose mutarotase [Bacteroidales bacterium]